MTRSLWMTFELEGYEPYDNIKMEMAVVRSSDEATRAQEMQCDQCDCCVDVETPQPSPSLSHFDMH